MIYRIKDWDNIYENNKSRSVDRCGFVCLPNKNGGLGLVRILNEPDGPAIFGIFVLIVEACSRHKRPRGGWLTLSGHQDDTAWTPEDLAMMFRRKEEEVARALDVTSSSQVDWVEVYGQCPDGVRSVSARCPPGVPEGKGREGKEPPPTPPASHDVKGLDWDRVVAALSECVPESHGARVVGEVVDSIRSRAPDSPTAYALAIIRRRGQEIREAHALEAKRKAYAKENPYPGFTATGLTAEEAREAKRQNDVRLKALEAGGEQKP